MTISERWHKFPGFAFWGFQKPKNHQKPMKTWNFICHFADAAAWAGASKWLLALQHADHDAAWLWILWLWLRAQSLNSNFELTIPQYNFLDNETTGQALYFLINLWRKDGLPVSKSCPSQSAWHAILAQICESLACDVQGSLIKRHIQYY